MVHQIVHCQFAPTFKEERVEWMMRETRIRLLKISEVRAMSCGKRIDPANPWRFFFTADYESMEKMALGHADPIYQGFVAEVIAPHVTEQLALCYEAEPGKDIRYS